MKPYNERLPLIDAVIDALSGNFESANDYRDGDNQINLIDDIGFFSVGGRWRVIGEFICTREEFEQRKAELAAKGNTMNDWHKKGELPPVGSVVECSLDFDRPKEKSNWNKIEVLYSDRSTVVGRIIEGAHGHHFSNGFEVGNYKFRPLRTEKDRLVEQAKAICKSWNDSCGKSIPELFVEANWRPIKPMTEDEFAIEVTSLLSKYNTDWQGILYQAGCRLIEQGE